MQKVIIKEGKNSRWFKPLTAKEYQERKYKRAYQRFMLGTKMGGDLKLLTLTTPENYKGDIHNAWLNFVKRMRRRGVVREYYVVKEYNKKHSCEHLHAVVRMNYVEYMQALAQWKAVTGASWIHIDGISKHKGMMSYLGKYMNKNIILGVKKHSYWYSFGWIYRKWRQYTKDMYRLGVSISEQEHRIIRKISDINKRIEYMNNKLIIYTIKAVIDGIVNDNTVKQYKYI